MKLSGTSPRLRQRAWRQVKLYFMCGCRPEPTPDVMGDRESWPQGHRGRAGDARDGATSAAPCRIGAGSLPSRHTPSKWGGRSGPGGGVEARLRGALGWRAGARTAAYGQTSIRVSPTTTGRSRPDRGACCSRGGTAIGVGASDHAAWRDGFFFFWRAVRRLERALLVRALARLRTRRLAGEQVGSLHGITTAKRDYSEVATWDHPGTAGLTANWLVGRRLGRIPSRPEGAGGCF